MLPEQDGGKIIARLKNDLAEMNRLIGEFMAFSRGLEKELPHSVDLNALLGEVIENNTANDEIVRWQPLTPCVRTVARMALQRIVGNLLSNALRYGAGKQIEVKCECGESASVIRVLDQGPGIPPEEIENVFRPFYRLESSRSTATGGSGLGLAIARQLSEVNGWKLALLPRPTGGIEACLTIPFANASGQ
jgi:two-component system osmolarity sensor histidine kinase EnvZ